MPRFRWVLICLSTLILGVAAMPLAAQDTISDINLTQLQSAFNARQDKVRVVALLSPT